MEELLQRIIFERSRQIISAWEMEEDLKKRLGERQWEKKGGYEALACAVEALVEKGLLIPVSSSGHNGRVPPLFARYRRRREKLKQPLELFNFRSAIDLSFYANNPAAFERDKEILLSIDAYLIKTAEKKPKIWDTLNERSFQLTGDEKFLASSAGAALLRRIKLRPQDLHCYPVPEPFFYREAGISPLPEERTKALVIENKDTFETFSRLQSEGMLSFSPPLHLFIYGEGNKITGSWPFLYKIEKTGKKGVDLYYFGDLDPEGIAIFCRLRQSVQKAFADAEKKDPLSFCHEPRVILSEKLYRLLLEQGRSRPLTGAAAAEEFGINFAESWCSPELAARIKQLWSAGKMIPQEALSASYLSALQEVEIG